VLDTIIRPKRPGSYPTRFICCLVRIACSMTTFSVNFCLLFVTLINAFLLRIEGIPPDWVISAHFPCVHLMTLSDAFSRMGRYLTRSGLPRNQGNTCPVSEFKYIYSAHTSPASSKTPPPSPNSISAYNAPPRSPSTASYTADAPTA
jgi:hypothetical protein